MRRVSVVGNSGSGKTTLGRALADALGAPFVELDGIFHQPGWTELPRDEFRAQVTSACAGDTWVVDGNYSAVQDLVWDRADTVVWPDLPRWRVLPRLVRRTVGRGVRRTELWNGNREQLRTLLNRDPRQSIVLWSFTNDRHNRERYTAAMADPANAHLRFVRLRTPAEIRSFLALVAAHET